MLSNIALIICVATTINFFFYYGVIAFTALRNKASAYIVSNPLGDIVKHLKFIILIAVIISVIRWLIH